MRSAKAGRRDPVEDMPRSACPWCRQTHPVDAECVTDPYTTPTEEEHPDE